MTHARRMDNPLIKIAEENVRTSSLHLAHINSRSIKNKILQFLEYITNVNIDLCAITETWLKHDDDNIAKVVPAQGYTFLSSPRQDGWRDGGIAFVSKSQVNIEEDKHKAEYQTMELLLLLVKVDSLVLSLYTVYRISNTNVLTFCNEMAKVLENNIVSEGRDNLNW